MKNIFLYIVLTSIIILLLNVYIAKNTMYGAMTARVDSNYLRLDEYTKHPSANDTHILIIGNSNVNASINLENHHENVVPFIMSGMPLSDVVRIVEGLPQGSPITTLLIGIGYNYATPVSARSSIYEKYFAKNFVARMWFSLPLARGQSLSVTILKEDIKCLLSMISSVSCNKAEVGMANEYQPSSPEGGPGKKKAAMMTSTRNRYREYTPFTTSVSPEFERYIERIKVASLSRGIELHMYTAPIYRDLRAMLSTDFLMKFRSIINASGIDYVDLNLIFPEWGPDMFGDATHVEKSTAGKITTDYLLRRIEISENE